MSSKKLSHALSATCLTRTENRGRINATLTRSGQTQTFFYTIGTNYLRIERGETDWPHARNIFNLQTGGLTLLFPHNRSYVRLKASSPNTAPQVSGLPLPPGGLPPGVGPQPQAATAPNIPALPALRNIPAQPPGVGPQASGSTPGATGFAAGTPQPPALPMMPMPGMDKLELRATDDKTNLLGYACLRYELKQRGEVMEIWATDHLLPYQPWQQNQPPRFGPRPIEEQWSELVRARKLFPLLASLKFENGPERLRFEGDQCGLRHHRVGMLRARQQRVGISTGERLHDPRFHGVGQFRGGHCRRLALYDSELHGGRQRGRHCDQFRQRDRRHERIAEYRCGYQRRQWFYRE